MGITVREMLSGAAFQDYQVIAGEAGLANLIQGIAIFDAPDAFGWTRGREFVLSSGYLFKTYPDLFERCLADQQFTKSACLGLKLRYLQEIPQEVMDACDELCIPLIVIPEERSWMEIIHALTVLVMNKNMRQFNIGRIDPTQWSTVTYHQRKIHQVLTHIEQELHFPAMLYEVEEQATYYSS